MKGFYSLINIPKVEKGAKREGRDLHRSACSGRDVNAHRRTEQISYSVFVPVDELCRCDDKKLHGRVGQAIEVHRAGLLAVHLSHSDARSILLLGPLAGLHQAGSQVDHATPYHGVKIRGAGTQRNRKGEGGGTRSDQDRDQFLEKHTLLYEQKECCAHITDGLCRAQNQLPLKEANPANLPTTNANVIPPPTLTGRQPSFTHAETQEGINIRIRTYKARPCFQAKLTKATLLQPPAEHATGVVPYNPSSWHITTRASTGNLIPRSAEEAVYPPNART